MPSALWECLDNGRMQAADPGAIRANEGPWYGFGAALASERDPQKREPAAGKGGPWGILLAQTDKADDDVAPRCASA
jgi:hypothetical protein